MLAAWSDLPESEQVTGFTLADKQKACKVQLSTVSGLNACIPGGFGICKISVLC